MSVKNLRFRRTTIQAIEAISKFTRKVQVRVMFTKMGEIDTTKECFSAEIVIQATWREEALDGATEEDIKKINFDQLWNPRLIVSNMITEVKEVTSYVVIFPEDNDLAYVLLLKKLKGCFMENLELQQFPFDIQDLTITITSELTSKQVQLIGDDESAVNTLSFVDEQEWKLRSEVRLERGETEDIVFGGQPVGRVHPYLNFKCTVERRYQYFLWNFAFILAFIGVMCLTTFSVDLKFPQNRLQLTFILLLTTIAFKTNVNNTLPKISYLTYMDKYFLGSWVIQCLMCSWHATVGCVLAHSPNVVMADRVILVIFFIIIILFQSTWALCVFFKLKKKQKSFDKHLEIEAGLLKRKISDDEMKQPLNKYSAISGDMTSKNIKNINNNNNYNNNNNSNYSVDV